MKNKFGRCSVCKKTLTKKDYFELCRKCLKPWIKGRENGVKYMKQKIRELLWTKN